MACLSLPRTVGRMCTRHSPAADDFPDVSGDADAVAALLRARLRPDAPALLGDPVKCPDCGVWWRGAEHRCAVNVFTATVPTAQQPPTWVAGTCSYPGTPRHSA